MRPWDSVTGTRCTRCAPGSNLNRASAPADDTHHDLLVASLLACAFADRLHGPSAPLRVAAVHAQQVSREQGGLVAAGAGPNFQIDVARVAGVGRYQKATQQQLEAVPFFFRLFELLPGRERSSASPSPSTSSASSMRESA